MTATDVAEWVSLALTAPTLVLCAWVVKEYGREAIEGVRLARRGVFSRSHLLVVGIAIGFAGSFMDNLYWGFAWSAEAVSHPSRDWWFANGVWSNLPFRQGAGILAGVAHVLAARKANRP